MLIDIGTRKQIDHVPFQKQFDTMRNRLSDSEFQTIVARVNELVDEAGGEIATAGWLPGNDWKNTPFQPIYTKAARRDYDLSARFFGQVVWYTIMQRPEIWASGRFRKNGVDIGSRTYFRVTIP